ncbi:MAG: SRPBCC family protein [Sphingopyxis sp.]
MRHFALTFLVAIAILALSSSGSRAEPVVSTPQAVVITIERDSATAPDTLFDLMASPRLWWSNDHTWSGDAANMTLDARAGGCWCEVVAGGPSVEHGRVLNFDRRRRTIVFDASLGPLQTEAIAARLQWQVVARDGGGSRVVWRYRFIVPDGAGAGLGPIVEQVLTQQVERLVAPRP